MATADCFPTDYIGAGGQSAFIPSSGTAIYDMVDETSADDDTTYFDSVATAWAVSRAEFTNNVDVPVGATVSKVSITARGRYPGFVPNGYWQLVIQDNFGDGQAVSATALTATYANYTIDWLTNPMTGTDWTRAGAIGSGSADQANAFAISSANGSNARSRRYTQIYLTVTYTGGDSGGGAVIYNPYDEVII